MLKNMAIHAAHKHAGGLFNVRYGFALLKDRSTPISAKALSMVIGLMLTGLLLILEIPLDGIIAFLAPFLGIAADIAFDGAELLLLPVLFACLVLPRLVRPLPN